MKLFLLRLSFVILYIIYIIPLLLLAFITAICWLFNYRYNFF